MAQVLGEHLEQLKDKAYTFTVKGGGGDKKEDFTCVAFSEIVEEKLAQVDITGTKSQTESNKKCLESRGLIDDTIDEVLQTDDDFPPPPKSAEDVKQIVDHILRSQKRAKKCQSNENSTKKRNTKRMLTDEDSGLADDSSYYNKKGTACKSN